MGPLQAALTFGVGDWRPHAIGFWLKHPAHFCHRGPRPAVGQRFFVCVCVCVPVCAHSHQPSAMGLDGHPEGLELDGDNEDTDNDVQVTDAEGAGGTPRKPRPATKKGGSRKGDPKGGKGEGLFHMLM